jgi:hypothetical protein
VWEIPVDEALSLDETVSLLDTPVAFDDGSVRTPSEQHSPLARFGLCFIST